MTNIKRQIINNNKSLLKRFISVQSHKSPKNKLNKYSNEITQPKIRGNAQAMLHALDLDKQQLSKPHIGIGAVWYESNPCNAKLDELSRRIKQCVIENEMLGFQFNTVGVSDGITMGTNSMRYSLPSRDLICDSFELQTNGGFYDGVVGIPGCDKNLPGILMALCKLNRPSLMVYGGAMPPSISPLDGKDLDIVSSFEAFGEYVGGKITDEEREIIIQNSCNKQCGACSGLYTANTMASIIEIMGMSLPNGATNPSNSIHKFQECSMIGEVMSNLIEKDIKPSDILTKESFENAIKLLYVMGGSTNAVIHLLAIAKSANIELTLDDFIKHQNTPVLANMKPHGKYVMNDLHVYGGMNQLVHYLIDKDIINGDCMTVTSRPLVENYGYIASEQFFPMNGFHDLIQPVEKPFKPTSHIRILQGNLAPEGCVSKIYCEDDIYEGEVIVFDNEKEMIEALEQHKIKKDHFVVIRYQGETTGCPEMLSPTSALIGYFGDYAPPLATDGRFSGGSKGILVAHLPDAYKDTITTILKDGDKIEIDLRTNSINVKLWTGTDYVDEINDVVINYMKNNFDIQLKTFESTGVLEKYAKLVGGLSSGYST